MGFYFSLRRRTVQLHKLECSQKSKAKCLKVNYYARTWLVFISKLLACGMGMRRIHRTLPTGLWIEPAMKGKPDIDVKIWWKYSVFLYHLAWEINWLPYQYQEFSQEALQRIMLCWIQTKTGVNGPSIFVSRLIRVGAESVNDMTVTRADYSVSS